MHRFGCVSPFCESLVLIAPVPDYCCFYLSLNMYAFQMSEAIVDTFVATDTMVKDTMKKVWDDNNYLVCPHTAIAVAYHYHKIRSLCVRS